MYILDISLTAVADNIESSKTYIKNFCYSIGIAPAVIRDILTTTGEAIENIVDHAYADFEVPGVMHIYADIKDGTKLVFIVEDEGTWNSDNDVEGKGTILMKALSKSFKRRRASDSILGTSVTLEFDICKNISNILERAAND